MRFLNGGLYKQSGKAFPWGDAGLLVFGRARWYISRNGKWGLAPPLVTENQNRGPGRTPAGRGEHIAEGSYVQNAYRLYPGN